LAVEDYHYYRVVLGRSIRRVAAGVALDIPIILAAYTAVLLAARAFDVTVNSAGSLLFLVFAILVLLAQLTVFGAYRRIWARTSGNDAVVLINAVLLASLVVGAVSLFVAAPISFWLVALGNALALPGLVVARYRSRALKGLLWRWDAVWHNRFPELPARVLIVGAGETGQGMAWRLKYSVPNGTHYAVVGFADDSPAKQGLYLEGYPVLGTCSEIPSMVARHDIDLIIIAIHNIDSQSYRRILTCCEGTTARIKVIPDVFALLASNKGTPLLRDIQPEDILGRKLVERNTAVDLCPAMGRVVLVTGAAGSIGSELCRQLMSYDPAVLIMLDNNESGLHDLFIELKSQAASIQLIPALVDITNARALRQVFAQHRPQIVFHSAAYKHVPMLEDYPTESIRVNVGGTRLVAEMASHHGAERFVLISTDKAVNPSNVMGASKRVCEMIVHALALQPGCQTLFAAVRFGNVLGSRGSVVPTFNRQIEAGGPVTVTDKDMTRYFMTISEAANLVIHAACLTQRDDLFMLRMGADVRIVELAERMIRMRGLRPYEDIPIEFTGVRPGEKLHEVLHAESETPVDTIHPDIFQLKSDLNGFDANAFLSRVNALLAGDWDDEARMRDALLDLARTDTVAGEQALPALAAGDLPLEIMRATAWPASVALPHRHGNGSQQTLGAPAASRAQFTKERSRNGALLPASHLPLAPDHQNQMASGIVKGPEMRIPMAAPDITQAEIDAVTEVLHTPWLSIGPKIDQFEAAMSAYVGTRHAVGVNSGTAGLHLAMIAAGVGPGDEVITPSFSFIASANCVVYEQGTPVFVDIDPLTGNVDPAAIEAAITERTKAIIAVDVFGQPADFDAIVEIGRRHNLFVIEDACEAIGAEYKERRAGTLADAAVFAFYPNKQMTTGEGGMIVTDNERWDSLFRSLRNQGRDVFDAWLSHTRLGYNYRLDEMSAALGLAQLGRIEELLAKRERVAEQYNQRIASIPGLDAPCVGPTTTRMSWFVYVIRTGDGVDRNALMAYLQDNGVPSRPYFTPLHLQPFYQERFGWKRGDLPLTEKAGDTFLALPFSGVMTEEQVDYVCQHLRIGVERAAQGELAYTHLGR
jgi:FlaA1/EpsC-like NDP-sugar epimerase/dTDP-4-amino-4,6-dideoxygalactose transaminase